MARVEFRTVVLNLASDLSQRLVLDFVTQINPTPQIPGETRMYGNGRYRGLTAGTAQKQHAIAAQAVEPDDLAKLLLWAGAPRYYGDVPRLPQTVCYRDDSGEKYYALITSPQPNRHSYDPNADVAFTVAQVTFDETLAV